MKKKNEQTTRTGDRWCALRQSAVVMKNIDEEEERENDSKYITTPQTAR